MTLAIVGGVVLVLGAALLYWVARADRDTAAGQARDERAAVADALRELARDQQADIEALAHGLSVGAQRRLRTWLEQEPLGLYRHPGDPSRIDVDALAQALVTRVRGWRRDEDERLGLLRERLAVEGDARIAHALEALDRGSVARAAEAQQARTTRLLWHLGLLLLLLAGVLAGVLAWLVIRPLHKTSRAVNQIAAGDLHQPVPQSSGGATEVRALARDVEHMRETLLALTEGLEDEVARKTRSLEESLAARTEALEEVQRTRARLVQSEKMAGLGTLAGGVAHEFNNLLGGILGCLESASEAPGSDAAAEDLAVARRTAERASSLVHALLDVARPGARALEPLDLRRIVDDVLTSCAPTAKRRGIVLDAALAEEAWVRGDDGQLHQVVLNLVTNALQAVEDEGRIEVRLGVHQAEGESGRVVLDVQDDGPGVAPDARTRIFEPFYTSREDGTGLGLFVSYGIVERHGGRLEVDDADDLGGARFRFVLPVSANRPAAC